jgi:hypothetical protein
MLSVTFDRASLSRADLVITDNPFAGGFHIPEDGVGDPQFAMRRTLADESSIVNGRILLASAVDLGTMLLRVYAHGDSSADVAARKEELAAATSQWSYDLTVTVDGVARTYAAQPELPNWGPIDSGMVKAHMAVCSIVIPINPGAL